MAQAARSTARATNENGRMSVVPRGRRRELSRGRRDRGVSPSRRDAFAQLAHEDEQIWNDVDTEERRHEHPGKDADSQRMASRSAGPARDDERHDAEDEGKR